MNRLKDTKRRRVKRKFRIRRKISGNAMRPRISVYRSNKFTYVQAVDDGVGHTLAAASNREKDLQSFKNTTEGLAKLGEEFGKRLAAKNIKTAVFDRNGYLYHGRVKALADGIRKSGIQV